MRNNGSFISHTNETPKNNSIAANQHFENGLRIRVKKRRDHQQ